MKKNTSSLSLLTLCLVFLVWVGVAFFAWIVFSMQADRADSLDAVEQRQIRDETAIRTHALLQETVQERAAIIGISKTEVLAVVDAVEVLGASAGIKLEVRGAQPGTVIPSKKDLPTLRPVNFSVQGEGTFAQITRALQLLEALPFPTKVTQFDIGRSPVDVQANAADTLWRMSLNLRLITTSDI